MIVATQFIEQGSLVSFVLKQVSLAASSWYYKATRGKKGIAASTHTYTLQGNCITNSDVVEIIEALLQQEFVDYGYIKVTHWLRQKEQLIINFKKVYRLMKEHKLLYHQHRRDRKGKTFIAFRVPKPELPLEHWETDIKFIYIHGAARMGYLLTVLDIKTRAVLGWILQYSIVKKDVINLLKAIIQYYALPVKVMVRSDNGSQFEAKMVREFLYEMNICQEFSHVATPEDNGHIEAYHHVIKRAVCDKYQWENIEGAKQTIDSFVNFYNTERLHSGIDYKSPYQYFFQLGVKLEPHPATETFCGPDNKNIYLYQFVESPSRK